MWFPRAGTKPTPVFSKQVFLRNLQQYFDKPFKHKIDIAHKPRKQLDPYEENEVKGTRIPDYSTVALDRDIYGELGWIPNFNIKKSKNNEISHQTYREFFDTPKDYNLEFHAFTQSGSEFYQKQAQESMSQFKNERLSNHSKSPSLNSGAFSQTRRSLNALERMSYSGMREAGNTSKTSINFVLQPDTSNRHAVSPILKKTVEMPNSIPFLRDPRNVDNLSFKKLQQLDNTPTVGSNRNPRTRTRNFEFAKTKEAGWNKSIVPISQINEGLHRDQRVGFEKI